MKRVKVTLRFNPLFTDGVSEKTTEGYEFEVCGFPFVVHRTVPEQMKEVKGWTVTEPVSGTAAPMMEPKPTRQAAIAYATSAIESHGAKAVRKAIEQRAPAS